MIVAIAGAIVAIVVIRFDYNKFSTEYKDKHKKNNCWKAIIIEKNLTRVLIRLRKKFKTQEQGMGDF